MDSSISAALSDAIEPSTKDLFILDAEANLVQWGLAAAPRHPVLKRAIRLCVGRVLAREPNIFLSTGPSVFTDAFLEEHGRSVYGSRTALDWTMRHNLLSQRGARTDLDGVFQQIYDGYEYHHVYSGGEKERYLPTWGSEPTRNLYHPRSRTVRVAPAAEDAAGRGEAGGGDFGDLAASASDAAGEVSGLAGDVAKAELAHRLRGRYTWRCACDAACAEGGGGGEVGGAYVWECALELRAPTEATKATPPHCPEAKLSLSWRHEGADGVPTASWRREMVGVWRLAPGRLATQLQLFEWEGVEASPPHGAPSGGLGRGGAPISRTEAPSVLAVETERCDPGGGSEAAAPAEADVLRIEGWEGSAGEVDSPAACMRWSAGPFAKSRQCFRRDA